MNRIECNIDKAIEMNRHVLKSLLQSYGLNEVELANKSGISQATINRIMNGANPDPKISTIIPIANYFGVTIGQLIGSEPLFNEDKSTISRFARIPILGWDDVPKYKDFIKSLTIDSWHNWTLMNAVTNDEIYCLIVKTKSLTPLFPYKTALIVDSKQVSQDHDFIIVHKKNGDNALIKRLAIIGDEKWLLDPMKSIKEVLFDNNYIYCGKLIEARIPYISNF